MAWKKPAEERVIDKWVTYVQKVLREAKRQRLIAPPPTGFGIGAIRKAVRIMIKRVEDPEELDWKTMWLRLSREEYDGIEDFIIDLEAAELLPPPPVEIEEEEEIPDVHALLSKLDLEMPSETDPYYQAKYEDLLRSLASDLIEAEKEAGKIKLLVHGKYHWYSTKGVTKLFDELHSHYRSRIRELERQLGEQKKRRREVEEEKRKAKLVKFTPLRNFKEGIIFYVKGKTYETDDEEFLKKRRSDIQIIPKEKVAPPPEKPPPTLPPEELVKVHILTDIRPLMIRERKWGPYKKSSVINIPKWFAQELIKEKLAEKHVPPPEVPTLKPKILLPVPERCPVDDTLLTEIKRVPIQAPVTLSKEEESIRKALSLPPPTREILRWIPIPPTMKVWMCEKEHFFERDARGRLIQRTSETLYKKILREEARIKRITAPPSPPPTIIPKEMAKELQKRLWAWQRRHVPAPKWMKAPGLSFKDWLLQQGFSWTEWLKLDDREEAKRWLDKWRSEGKF